MSNRIRELRKNKGLTLKDFASKLNKYTELERDNVNAVTYSTISRWEKGITEPTLLMWQKMADYFDVPVSYLQGITDDEVKKNTEDIFYMVSVVLDAYRKVLSEEEAIVLTNGKKFAGKDKDNVLLGFEFAKQAINKYKKFVYLFSSDMDEEQMLKLMTKIFRENDNDD